MGEKSTVARANTKSLSIRTTIPEKIAKELKLNVGDVLDWEVSQEGKKIAKIRRLE